MCYNPRLEGGPLLLDFRMPVVHRRSAFGKPRDWVSSTGLAVAVSITYFLAARLSLLLLTKPDGVAVFWPAAGVAAGTLIALGPRARWPVAVGAMGATIVAHILAADRGILGFIVFASCNGGEAVLVAWLIEHCFGSSFRLDRLPNVLGLLAAAIVGTAVSGIGGTAGYVLFQSSTAPILTTWQHWFASDALGIITVTPLLIGLGAAARDPPRRDEFIEGGVALVALAVVSGLVIFLPREPWAVVVPVALLFPLLLWLAARCKPVFTAAAAFIVAFTIVLTITFGIGIFDGTSFPIAESILTAQAGILTVSLCGLVLAALFSERRESVAHLVRSNIALQRERDNKLMNLEAMAASISHEVKQPLAAIATNGEAAQLFLERAPPDLEEVRSALDSIVNDSQRVSEMLDNVCALFGSVAQQRRPVDVNEMVLGALRVLGPELEERRIVLRTEFILSERPLVMGHKGQLQEVIINLARNAIEAMDAIKDGNRALHVKTQRNGRDAITVLVNDTGPGIDPKKLDRIFEAFVTTKAGGMGLGLAICRTIIERHGGQLTATSDGKRGASFQFVLPIELTVGSSTTQVSQ
jgi:signal transduction histidine kinase